MKKNILPETTRFSFVASKDVVKGIKKFAIDFELSEKEVPLIAVEFLLKNYNKLSSEDIAIGLDAFLST